MAPNGKTNGAAAPKTTAPKAGGKADAFTDHT